MLTIHWNLTKQPTRVLMGYLAKARACGGYGYDPTENHGNVIPISAIKTELAKREHVPNKTEAKKIRQQRAKMR